MISDSYQRLTLHYTSRCTMACDHCITLSSPRTSEKLDFEVARKAILDAIDLGFIQVGFTGGEALLYKEEVFALSRIAREAGISVLIMTNAFWARSPRTADLLAADCAKAGASHVCISTDRQHVKAGITFEATLNGVRALREHGINVKVQYSEEKDDPLLDEFKKIADRERLIVDVFPIYPFGRARECCVGRMIAQPEPVTIRCPHSPLVKPSLQVMKCCGGSLLVEDLYEEQPLLLGDLSHESFKDVILRAREGCDPLLLAFCAWGPKKLAMLLAKDFWTREEKPPFYGLCDICCRLLNDRARVAELRPLLDTPAMRTKIRRHAELIDAFDKSEEGMKRKKAMWDYDYAQKLAQEGSQA